MKSVKVQKTGLKRQTTDKFYTCQSIVDECMELFTQHIDIDSDNDLCIEPSAGNGSFINSIQSLCNHHYFYDIEPENDEIIKKDYLQFDFDTDIQDNISYNKIHIIGNPPFGRQSSLAIKFIKISTKFCDSLSFILPKSFKKDSLQKHFPLNFHLIHEYDIPKNSFLVNDKTHDVPCVFQIWVKKQNERQIPKKLTPSHFKFVKKTEPHDISFRRVGVNAGNIDKNTDDKSIQSHYFIKFDKKMTNKLFTSLSNIQFNCKDNTTGPKSISKQELIQEFNKLL